MTGASDVASSTAGPASKTLSNASKRSLSGLNPGHGYPHGHLGHLTADEQAALTALKEQLAKEGLYTPGPPAPSHDDTVVLRFLRARRWVVADAAAQFRDTEHWRKAVSIDVLYDTIDVEAYDHCRRLYPQWLGRRDRRGIPVYLFEIRHLDSKTVAAYEKSAATTYSKVEAPKDVKATKDARMVRLFALYENLTRFVQPLCTQMTDRDNAKTPITLSTNIVDVSGVSLRQFWNLKSHMQVASQLATAHYPETLDKIFIIGAPAFFSTVWGWVKRWFDPVTVSKIFILSQSEVLPTLTAFIDPENIPKQYGGKLEFKWCDMPNLDPKIRTLASWEEGHTEFPKGPVYWVPVDGGKRLECLARGSVDKKERSEKVCSIPVAFPEEETKKQVTETEEAVETKKEEDEIPATSNGHAVEGATEEPTKAEAPVSTDTAADATVPETTPHGGDKPADIVVVDTQGVQNLSLREAEANAPNGSAGEPEKVPETNSVPNGKPVTAA